MRQNVFISVRCTPDLRAAIEAMGREGGISHVVRRAVVEYVQRNREPEHAKAESNPPCSSKHNTRAAA